MEAVKQIVSCRDTGLERSGLTALANLEDNIFKSLQEEMMNGSLEDGLFRERSDDFDRRKKRTIYGTGRRDHRGIF